MLYEAVVSLIGLYSGPALAPFFGILYPLVCVVLDRGEVVCLKTCLPLWTLFFKV